MAAISNYLEGKLLDHTLAGVPYTPPAVRYVSLHTASPGDAASVAAEVAGGGYQRALTQFNTSINGSTSNSNTLAYPNMPAVTVSHIAVWDGPPGAAANMLFHGALASAVIVTAGGTFVINAGGLTVALD